MKEDNNTTRVLLAEDEPALGMIVKESLDSRGFQVTHKENGKTALEAFEKGDFDVLVLDVMMPEMDGFTLAKNVREVNEETPIIFLTAKSQTDDVLEGFHVGGNDYLKKPFSMEELIVRIKNLLSRQNVQKTASHYTIGAYDFNFPRQELTFDGEVTKLTHRESHLLYHLVLKKNNVLDRTYILKKLWGDDDFFSGRSMDVFITKLRKKLAKDPQIEIVNVRGFGYKLITEE